MKRQNDRAIAKILFVCSGNVCRSVMAEALFKDRLNNTSIQVQSAGISAVNGASILPNTRAILATQGIDYRGSSQVITSDLIRWSDLILTMTQSHKYFLLSQLPHITQKVFTLKEYVGETEVLDLNIPQENLASYGRCLREIETAIELLIKKIQDQAQKS